MGSGLGFLFFLLGREGDLKGRKTFWGSPKVGFHWFALLKDFYSLNAYGCVCLDLCSVSIFLCLHIYISKIYIYIYLCVG